MLFVKIFICIASVTLLVAVFAWIQALISETDT